MSDPVDTAQRVFLAYVNSDRAEIEALLADEFHFTSPYDNRIDRQTYLERCWPSHNDVAGYNFIRFLHQDDVVIVTYEMRWKNGSRLRNTEVLTIQRGQVLDVEVYFGWSLPHAAASGRFVTP
ncbi:nuclear transport factor 2 family protein [Luteithermobacter gelatinilyticus]|uniref:nuclear transport factor 2 family protein n=1 Tax=Luteithermobacter gelatinilyticus TaxID=2582913 RepID=UPI001106E143|nr:nuclear transport factor 2 family protein [Luteithermobacter gelatinilyticus]|tara:strand:- start:377 stop:745 length:369 start_codon:yes stop_codon:yes gene_type:complete